MNQTWTNHLGQTLIARVPPSVEPYVGALGQDIAAKFIMEFGGSAKYLPTVRPGRQLVAMVGDEGYRRLVDFFGSRIDRVPYNPTFICRHLRSTGVNVSKIARLTHRTDKTVRQALAIGGGNPPARLLQDGEAAE